MTIYYGLNRQGAATSGRYTRTPISYAVPVRRVPAAQPLGNIQQVSATRSVQPAQKSITPGGGGNENQSNFSGGYTSPEAARAADIALNAGLYSPGVGFMGLGKKVGARTALGLGFGASPSVALGFGLGAITPSALVGAGLRTADQAIGLNRTAVKSAPELQRNREATLMQDRPYKNIDDEDLATVMRNYTPTVTDKIKTFFGGDDMSVSDAGTGTPGSTLGDYGNEARMGTGVGDVAGVSTQDKEASRIGGSGTGSNLVGRDYGGATDGGSGGSSGGGGYGAGIGGEGQSAGYK